MATTAESIVDGLRWLGRTLVVWLRRGVILGAFIGLFVAVAWFTGRERFGDCGDVTAEQRAQLDALQEPAADRSFLAADAGRCVRGNHVVPLTGIDGDLETVVDRLGGEGWRVEATLLPYYYNLLVRCLATDDPGWESIEVSVAASRAGRVARAEARAAPSGTACEPYNCQALSTGCERYDRLEP